MYASCAKLNICNIEIFNRTPKSRRLFGQRYCSTTIFPLLRESFVHEVEQFALSLWKPFFVLNHTIELRSAIQLVSGTQDLNTAVALVYGSGKGCTRGKSSPSASQKGSAIFQVYLAPYNASAAYVSYAPYPKHINDSDSGNFISEQLTSNKFGSFYFDSALSLSFLSDPSELTDINLTTLYFGIC